MNSPLLSGKFEQAGLPGLCAPRHALVERFQEESGKRIVYVSAPAGYGKTVSTKIWLKDSGRVPLWISLDEYDNTPSIFYKLFCAGVLSLQPHNKAMADILKSPAFASSPVEHTIRLLSEFVPDSRQYAVVLDDMQLVSNKEIRKSGLLVQKRLPSSFVLVILTRNKVEEEYIAVTGEAQCAVITAEDLAFSPEEIHKYFGEHGRLITKDEASAVHTVSNGWAIGINAMAMSGQLELDHNAGSALGSYIRTQIWDKWDEGTQRLLLKTSIPDEMTPELAEMLTGTADSRKILEKMCAENMFVSKTGDGHICYHHLFLEFLRSMHGEIEAEERAALYKAAAEYYIDKGEYFAARRCATKSGHSGIMMQVILKLSQYGSASVDEFVNFSKMYANEALPASLCDKAPFLYATQMWEHYLCGNAAGMEYYMDKIYQYLPVIAAEFPQELETVLMEISLDHRTPLSKQIEQFNLLPPITHVHDSQQGATLTHELPFLHRSNRDYAELLDDALRERLRVTFGQLFKGSFEMLVIGIESGLFLEKNLPREALDAALRMKAMENEGTSDELCFSIGMHLAAVYYAMGNAEWRRIMAETESAIQKNNAYYLRPNFLAYQAKLMLLNGDKSAAHGWLDNYFVTESDRLELYKIFQHFTTARAYMVLSQTDKAMSYITKLKKLGTDFNRPLDIAEAGVLQAALEWALGGKNEAVSTLEAALGAMEPYGFVRVFADEGAAVLPILKKLAANLKKQGGEGKISLRYLNEIIIAAYEQSKRYKGVTANIGGQKPVKLSKQQTRIVALLGKGYKNTDIAELTGLTIHTVKSHCAAAYAKLGVNSAMDAVVKAKALNLIE